MAFLVPSSGEGGTRGKDAIYRHPTPQAVVRFPRGRGTWNGWGCGSSVNSGHCGKCRWEESCEFCREGWEDGMAAPGSRSLRIGKKGGSRSREARRAKVWGVRIRSAVY